MIGNVRESDDWEQIVFRHWRSNREIRVVSRNGGEDAVAGMPTVKAMTDWAVGKDRIFFLDRRALPTTIKFFDLSTKKYATLNKPAYDWGGLSLSPDWKLLAYSQVDDKPADIMLVENVR